MRFASIALLVSFSLARLLTNQLAAQQTAPQPQNPATTPNSQPNVFFGEKEEEKKVKGATRPVHGTVKDSTGNAIPQAIVALKNVRTGKKIETIAHDDGSYRFEELKITDDYELQANHDKLTSAPKKLSMYDSRRDPIMNFELEPKKDGPPEAKR